MAVPQTNAGNPNGILTSRFAFDLAIDTDFNELYYAPLADSLDWILVAGAYKPQTYAGDPNGFLTSRFAYEIAINTLNDQLYYATTAGSTVWLVIIGGTPGGGS